MNKIIVTVSQPIFLILNLENQLSIMYPTPPSINIIGRNQKCPHILNLGAKNVSKIE